MAVAGLFAWGAEVRAQRARFAARSELVVLSAAALDKNGRPVTDLRREEFRIAEDGRPQKLQHFSQATESHLRLLLLVDASGSMSGALKSASPRMAAVQILASLAPEDEAALAGFDHKYWGIVAFTRDRKKIEEGFVELEPFGSTALHDALDRAASDLASHGEGRRAVVVITDGVDTASLQTPDEVIGRSRALVLSIPTGLALLGSFPSSTGGALVFAQTIQSQGLCARCELKETEKCQTTIRVQEDKRRVVYYAEDNQVARDFQAKACESVKPVTATGTVRERGGKLLITLKQIAVVKP